VSAQWITGSQGRLQVYLRAGGELAECSERERLARDVGRERVALECSYCETRTLNADAVADGYTGEVQAVGGDD
jgi:hypothetical protein